MTNSRAIDHMLRSAYAALLVYLIGVASAALLAPLVELGTPLQSALKVGLALATFGFPVVAPVSVFAGVALACVLSSEKPRWIVLVAAVLCSGLAASWLFQNIRPFDLYHEADRSQSSWQPSEGSQA